MDDATHRHIVSRLNKLRTRRGWSQNELAAESGVSKAQLSRLINLQTSPTIGLLGRMAAALGVVTRDLLPKARP